MIGILVVTHGRMAGGILDSLEMIDGINDAVDFASLMPSQNFESFKENLKTKIEELDSGDGVLVFVDLYGASPSNAVLQLYQELSAVGHELQLITGVNLPMLLEANVGKSGRTLEELTEYVVKAGKESIQMPLDELLEQHSSKEGDDY